MGLTYLRASVRASDSPANDPAWSYTNLCLCRLQSALAPAAEVDSGTHSIEVAQRAAVWPGDNATSRTRAVPVVTLARWHASGLRHSSAQLCRIQRRVTPPPATAGPGPGQGGSPALSHSILAQSGSFSPLNYDRQPASGERALRRPSPVSRRPPLAITDSIDRAAPSRAEPRGNNDIARSPNARHAADVY